MSCAEETAKPTLGPWPRRVAHVRMDKQPWVRRGGKLLLDFALAFLAWILAASLEGDSPWDPGGLVFFLCMAMVINLALHLSSQHYRLLEMREAKAILFGDLGLMAAVLAFCAVRGGTAPAITGRDAAMVACLLCGVLWFLARLAAGALSGMRRPDRTGRLERTLIVGAGRAGMRLCQEVLEHPRLALQVVGFVDDAPEKQGLRIQGVPVLGATDRLAEFIRERHASTVILGMAGVAGARLRELSRGLEAQGVKVKTVPGIQELVGDHPWKPEWRDVAIEDLLRRDPVTLDTAAIRKALEGTVALITGAGGSIGSELARRVASFGPRRLVLLGRGENSLWEIERDLARRFPALRTDVALCDVRDPARLAQVFRDHAPAAVFHAAAHKHVPYLELQPEEAVLNNIFGTRNVLRAALDVGAGVFVNVSTDKAVNPVNVLGVSKRIGENLVTQAAAHAPAGSRYVSVRFGNVLGSRGSVIPLFREQIARGGPITVTHPDMTRYFMTIPEAVQLVLQAGILGGTAKVYALDMGEPVKILDLALDMARLSGLRAGVDIDIQFTGTRPGEKLVEELFTDLESRQAAVHAKVFEALQDRQDPTFLERGLEALENAVTLPADLRQKAILAWFQKLVPAYRPSPSGMGRHLAGNGASLSLETETIPSGSART